MYIFPVLVFAFSVTIPCNKMRQNWAFKVETFNKIFVVTANAEVPVSIKINILNKNRQLPVSE